MKLGKIMFVSMLLLVILAVGAVSASDANDTLKATDDDNILESANGFEDKLEINEANDVLKATPKTFTELNATINGNKDSEIYLDSNYTYESGTDGKFKSGVIIDRAVTVYGNGYTLNGNNAARIFQVKNSNVTFKNIFFVNGKATEDDYYDYYDKGHGGAINGNCTAINCIFNSNSASEYGSGGAMYNGSAVNCTFVNNSANGDYCYGGAMYGGSAMNCTFNSNFAIYGGAMYGGSAVNCTFNSNSWGAMRDGSAVNCTFVNNSGAVGGAMRGGSAVNCTFNFNSAVDGGAMYGGSAVNCTFNFNSAEIDGGAMSDSNAVNCTFNSNSASYYGGAMYVNRYDTIKHIATGCVFTNNTAKNGGATYYIYANNCQFNKNTATENGGAMYDCNAEDSTFAQNHADGEGGAVYNVVVGNCLFEYNSATNGGAMSRSKTSNSKFNHNTATNYGGAVYNSIVSTNSEFNDNNAPNGANTYNETWFNPEKTKTFTDLNELINNNNETNIYLNSNYSFDSYDFLFKEGIIISRAVTVWGNGYTISGEGLARIFTVNNIDVVFKDIIFVNGKATRDTYGGAINGESTAINCTFNSNSYAMYHGSAVNCTFNSNSGCICGDFEGPWCNAVNCTFNSNSGGIFNGYAVNCIFVNNSRAMSDCSARNCTFNSNSGDQGGAIEASTAVNCTFVNNFASESGGAIFFGSAVNCTFVNNSANGRGGAIYWCDAVNCTFINNKATGNGTAVYSRFIEDTVINCTFINCSANVVYAGEEKTIIANCTFETQGSETLRELVIGGNTSNCTVKKYKDKTATNITITVNDITYGETLNIIVNVQKDATGNMTLNINTKDYTANIENGQAAFNITGLNAGNYEVKVDYAGDSNYMAAQNITQICVNKVSTAITSSAVTTIYNVNKNLIIILKDAEGNPLGGVDIIVNLNGAQTYTTGDNGQVKVPTRGLAPKTYTAKITFKGNTNYDKSARNVKVTVKKATPKLSAKAKTFKKSVKTKKYTVTLKTNSNKVMKNTKLTLKVNGKTYTAKTNAKGQATFKITKLTKKGKFTAVVKFAGNKYYNAKTVKPKIIVK